MAKRARVFSEQEAAEIVQRAVELQESSPKLEHGYTPGITLEELHRVAAEVGVQPEFLEQALILRDQPAKAVQGSGGMAVFERVLDGELDPADFDLLLEDFRTPMQSPVPSQIGRTLKFRTSEGTTSANVTITARNGRTRIKVEWMPVMGCVAAFYPALFGVILSMGFASRAGMAWLGFLLAFAIVIAAGHIAAAVNRSIASRMQAFEARLEGKVASLIANRRMSESAPAAAQETDAEIDGLA